jgi:hypothetical protein
MITPNHYTESAEPSEVSAVDFVKDYIASVCLPDKILGGAASFYNQLDLVISTHGMVARLRGNEDGPTKFIGIIPDARLQELRALKDFYCPSGQVPPQPEGISGLDTKAQAQGRLPYNGV